MPPVTPSAMSAIYSSSTLTTLRRRISFCAIAIFLSPASRGTAPFSSWRARLPARTTNSKRFSFGALSMVSLQADLKVRLYVQSYYLGRLRGAKRFNDGFGRLSHVLHARPLGQHDGAQPLDRRVQLVVDHHVLVGGELADLPAGHLEALLNRGLRVGRHLRAAAARESRPTAAAR